jgi:hypothetical protein
MPELVRAHIARILSGEYGFSMVEMKRHSGVCTSGIAEAIKKER